MQPTLTWRSLTGGLIAITIMVVVTVVVLVFGRVGALRGERVELFVTAPDAGGLLAGSDVWLAGRKIGRVKEMRTMPASPDSMARVILVTEVLDEHAPQVRRDAAVRITPGGRLLGAPVLSIGIGSAGSPPVRSGDTLRTLGVGMLGNAAERVAQAREKLPQLAADAKAALADVKSVMQLAGSAGARVPTARMHAVMDEAGAVQSRLTRFASGGDGALLARVKAVRARVDSFRVVLDSPGGTYGRFRRDSTLALAIADARAEASALSARMSSPDGTLGRMAADSALQREMAAMSKEMAALFANIKKRPLRYLSF